MVYQSNNRISDLFSFKDVVTTKERSHILYKFMCSCSNATHYKKKKKYFFVRSSVHLGITPLTSKFVKMPNKSAIFDMLLDGDKDFEKKAMHLN